MISFDMILIGLMLLFGIIYMILIALYTIGWYRLKSFQPNRNLKLNTRASIIIPARNEEANIINLLNDLAFQDVDRDLF